MAFEIKKQAAFLSLILSASLGLVVQAAVAADIKAVTVDGRQVLLKEDQTWEFVEVEAGDPSVSAVLTVTRLWDMEKACKLQFRLQNNLSYRISTLVPRLTVVNQEGVVYDSKSIAFASIKPTNDKYTDVQFERIGCHEISHIRVHDAARCRMGDIDQWNEEEGECLSHIYVEPSELINISK
ncbi:MAG: DUF3157 family protein [Halioglobus sp.]|nr:DUF3157 family protein [Halioglobus sp.]